MTAKSVLMRPKTWTLGHVALLATPLA